MKALLLVLLAPPAAADDYTGRDRAWSIAAGIGGGAAMGLLAGFLGASAAVGDEEGGNPTEGEDFLAFSGFAVAAPLGIDLGAAGGVFAYGELTGHDGSLLVALAGSTVGTLAGLGFLAGMVAVDDDLGWLGVLGLLTAPAIGATIGYELSVGLPDPHEAPPTGALFDYAPVAGLRLSVPVLGVATDGRDGAVSLSLLGGRF